MTVARAVYTDLNLNFTLSSTTIPTITNASNLLTKLYKQAYNTIGETYAAYSASAEHSIIDTETTKELIIVDAEEILNLWAESASIKDNRPAMPRQQLSMETKGQLAARKVNIVLPSYTNAFKVEDGLGD